MSTTTAASPRRAQFEAAGYLLGLPILSPSEVLFYRAAYERLERDVTKRSAKGRITNMHHTDPDMWNLATHPQAMSLVRELIGDDIVLVSTGFFAKQPGTSDQFVAWHQDTMYWGLTPPFAVTLWIAIDDSDVENGCMRVIPHTHHSLLPHRKSNKAGNLLGEDQEIPAEHLDETKAVDMILRAGQASVHHGELVHGSNPNCSTRRRCGMTLRFTRPDVRPVTDGPFPFRDKPILVAGADPHGHFAYVPKPAFAK